MNESSATEKPEAGLEEIEKEEVRAYFEAMRGGTCVEVGANDPLAPTSQSLHLERLLDWSCLLVEPIPDLAAKARELRPRATVCECACTRPDRTGEVDLFIPVLPDGDVPGHASLQRNKERLQLFNRMYLGIWPRKVRYALRKRDWGPLKSL